MKLFSLQLDDGEGGGLNMSASSRVTCISCANRISVAKCVGARAGGTYAEARRCGFVFTITWATCLAELTAQNLWIGRADVAPMPITSNLGSSNQIPLGVPSWGVATASARIMDQVDLGLIYIY